MTLRENVLISASYLLRYLNERGIEAAVLEKRLPQADRQAIIDACNDTQSS